MPMYDYSCPKCNLSASQFKTVENRKGPVFCHKCKGPMVFIQFPQDTVKPGGRPRVKDVFRKF